MEVESDGSSGEIQFQQRKENKLEEVIKIKKKQEEEMDQ